MLKCFISFELGCSIKLPNPPRSALGESRDTRKKYLLLALPGFLVSSPHTLFTSAMHATTQFDQPGRFYVMLFCPSRNWWGEKPTTCLTYFTRSAKSIFFPFQVIIHFAFFNAIISGSEACLV